LCAQLGAAGTCGCLALRLGAAANAPGAPAAPKQLPALKDRAYCGLICGDWCALWRATRANDPAQKAKVHREWRWKEKFGVEYNPDTVFCWGCKAPGQPRNVAQLRCTVLKCSAGRGFESCLQCRKLAPCDKDLWKDYPDFHQKMVKLQQQYVAAEGLALS